MPISGVSSSEPHGRAQRDQRYDSTTIWLHWPTVALVAILWILAQVTGWLPRGLCRSAVWSTHVVLGLTLAVVLAMRILWRAGFESALPPADTGVLHWLAKGTQPCSLSAAACRSHFGDRQCIVISASICMAF